MDENTPQQPEQQTPAPATAETPPVVKPVEPAPDTPVKKSKLLIPLIIVLVLSLVGASWYFLVYNREPAPAEEPVSMAAPTPKPLFLDVTSPTAETTAVNGEILVSGQTLPNTTVFVFTDTDDTGLTSDAQGNFETSVVVGDTGGLLRITAYGVDGTEQTKTLTVNAQ